MTDLTEGFATKADKMRVLERAGYARADIARFLGVRYQQVRNTLEGDKRTGYAPPLVAVDSGRKMKFDRLTGRPRSGRLRSERMVSFLPIRAVRG